MGNHIIVQTAAEELVCPVDQLHISCDICPDPTGEPARYYLKYPEMPTYEISKKEYDRIKKIICKVPTLVNWIDAKESLPPMDTIVIIFRCDGVNKDHVCFAYRRHRHGTKSEWEWLDNGGTGWGIACDHSQVSHWMPMPDKPV